MTEKIIYTKYSNDRAPQYCIATDIVKKGESTIIRKRAVNKKATSHVKQLLEKERKLNDCYKESRYKVNHIISSSDDAVDFEYIEGTSFEEILDGYLERNDMEGLVGTIRTFFQEYEKCVVGKFEKSETFLNYFGNLELPDDMEAMTYGNIDLIFQNVIVDKNDEWNVIDYEWAIDCMIPIRYVMYRSIYLYIHTQSKRRILIDNDLFGKFGFTEQERLCFDRMEQHFQRTIKAGHMQLGDCQQMMGKPVVNSRKMFAESERNLIQVFYDYGNGFTEEDKRYFTEFPIRVHIDSSITKVKVIPMYDRGLIEIKSIADDNGRDLPYNTQGRNVKDNWYYYNDINPEIIIEDNLTDSQCIFIDLQTETMGIHSVLLTENTMNTLNTTISTLNSTQTELDAIQASFVWKITKPIRIIADKLSQARR